MSCILPTHGDHQNFNTVDIDTKDLMMMYPSIFDSYKHLLILTWWACNLRQQDYTEASQTQAAVIDRQTYGGRSQNEKWRIGRAGRRLHIAYPLSPSLDVIAAGPSSTRTIYDFSINLLLSHFFGTKM